MGLKTYITAVKREDAKKNIKNDSKSWNLYNEHHTII